MANILKEQLQCAQCIHSWIEQPEKKRKKLSHTHSSQASKPLCKQQGSVARMHTKALQAREVSQFLSNWIFEAIQQVTEPVTKLSFMALPSKESVRIFVRPVAVWHLVSGFCSASGAHDVIACLCFFFFFNTLQGRIKVWCSLLHWTWRHAAEGVTSCSFCSQNSQFYGNACHTAVQRPHQLIQHMQNLSE